MNAKLLSLAMLVALLPGLALAEDPKAKAAREELERQLNQMVGKQPTRVRIDMIGLDDPNYRLEEASFELDGRALRSPSVTQLGEEGTHLVWEGDAPPGKHVVKVRLVFANGASVLLSDEGGYKWTLSNERSFELHSGIEVRVAVTPKRDSTQREVAKRFGLTLPATPVMIAQLDDGKMPEPAPKPVVAEPDAGPSAEQLAALAAADKQKAADAAAELKRLAEEEKKAKAEAAAELKRAAAEEKKRKAAEAAEKKRAAAEEKKRKAAEAAEAKRAAAEEKKRAAAEAAEAKRLAAEEKKRLAAEAVDRQLHPEKYVVVDAGAPAVAEVVDAGAPVVAEVVDAGPPAPVAVVVDAGVPAVATAPVPPEETGNTLWIALGAGAGGFLVLLILLARRRSRPPTLDD